MAMQIEQGLYTVADTAMTVSYLQIKLLGAKTLPLLAAACVPTPGRWKSALCWSIAAGLIVVNCAVMEPTFVSSAGAVCAALGYYVVVTTCSFWLSAGTRSGALRKDALFCILALLFVFGPAPILRQLGQIEMLVLGWGIMLSVYSYCVEAKRASQGSTLRQFLFFVLVDPTLSFPDRSRPLLVSWKETVKRLAGGLSLMILARGLVAAWRWSPLSDDRHGAQPVPALVFVLAALVAFFAVYWVRAGAAHIRIALMQTLGFQSPECFRQPYRATSPADFWRRWNCWVGDWMKRYLYVPLALTFLRRGSPHGMGRSLTHSLAIVSSFGAMGLLHDWVLFGNHGRSNFIYLRVFVFAAFGMIAWEMVAVRRYGKARDWCMSQRWAPLASRFGAAAYVSAMLAIAGAI
jgi:hypothetical protein